MTHATATEAPADESNRNETKTLRGGGVGEREGG